MANQDNLHNVLISSGTDMDLPHGFSQDFVFGTASSAYQYEGAALEDGKGRSIWDTFTQMNPGKIKDGSNGYIAVDSYNRYKEDVAIMKKMGVNAYRFSISWPRILPGGKLSAGVNKEGIQFYNNLINELLANGIEPYVTLFHWDLPYALEEEYGGFLSSRVVADFCDYVDLCFWEFGDRVKNWITLNEPWTYSVGGYVNGNLAPGRGPTLPEHIKSAHLLGRCCPWHDLASSDGDPGTEPYWVTHHQLLAHSAAVELYKQKYQPYQEGKIGITLVSEWMEPLDETNDRDIKAASRALDFMFGWFMDPLTTGDYPQSMRKLVGDRLPKFSPEQSEKLKKSYDFLGLNYYTAKYATDAQSRGENLNYNTDYLVTFTHERDGKPIGEKSALDWLYSYPKGIYKLLVHIKTTYNVPLIYITENGWADANDVNLTLSQARADKSRIKYYEDHLGQIQKAIVDGVNVKGYFAWSLLDNFEWGEGYTVRFGIFHINYWNGLTRYPKDSALWFANFFKKRNVKPSSKRQIADSDNYQANKKIKK